jgi:hypothetical protein
MLTTQHPSIRASWQYILPTSGGRSVGIVRLWTEGHGVFFYIVLNLHRAVLLVLCSRFFDTQDYSVFKVNEDMKAV